MKIEEVSAAIENETPVYFKYNGDFLEFRIQGVISRYDKKKRQWYYVLELADKSTSITVVKLEDVSTEKEKDR